MQYFEDCECEGVLFLTFKGGGGQYFDIKVGGGGNILGRLHATPPSWALVRRWL